MTRMKQLMFSEMALGTMTKLNDDERLAATLDDYRLTEEMNKLTITKYSDMKQIAGNVSKALEDLNGKYRCLKPYLDQIDQVEDSVTKLEQAAYKLDAYSKRLEANFKVLEKR
ncbi:hypothetical protein HPB51_018511 [Rhipicephalus microplus]|uniref:Biogenesis of lysosome-related organelles complex 1 subunit 2 n=1 Tax=Rhipicephalus microplus TaxID=6941 RepID=A0A9J6EJ15_RHIMP|nr:hypothetical protein HPB51_018511 [Rhipicephalus microplus]